MSFSILKWGLVPATILGMLLSVPSQASADVTISLDAGYLYGPLGATALPANSLLLLVASASGTTFGGPTVGSYTSGGDVILGAAGFNTNNGTGGTLTNGGGTTNPITFLTANYPTSLSTSDYVALYWFPGITLAQYNSGTKPSLTTTFGAYNPEAINITPSTSLAPDGGNTWQLPPNPSANYRLNFFTTADFGTQPEGDGYARFIINPVPEPSAYIGGILGCAVISFAGMRKAKRRAA